MCAVIHASAQSRCYLVTDKDALVGLAFGPVETHHLQAESTKS